jgi:hypothetical protein
MTKTGHPQARRVLGEGAWAYRYPAQVRRQWPLRLEHHPKSRPDRSWKAHGRLGKRYRRLGAKGTHAPVVTGASARELVGFGWAMAPEVPRTLESPQDRFGAPGLVRNPWRRCPHVQEKRRRPGAVYPSAA